MKLFSKIFNSGRASDPGALTRITRTEVLEGFAIPGIINNMQYHFTNLQVYSDGLIYCWEMVDLAMFKQKLDQGWVVTAIPDGAAISIFGLGHWYIEQGVWLHTKATLYQYVYALVKQLNPALENLQNCHGSSTRKVGNINVAKHSIPDAKPFYLDNPGTVFPDRIHGAQFHCFYRDTDTKTYLAQLSLYESGRIEITNLPGQKVFSFEDIRELVDKKTITTTLDPGETVTILNLGSFKIVSGAGVDILDKLNELTDKFRELNGQENSITKCARIFEAYKATPTLQLKNELKEAYEAVPEHQRMFVGNMDTKDYEVRQVIYGDSIKKEWQEAYGFPYPYADMPKPVDE
ncbi:DUF7638 domain-containing protein [Taibaiella chishuiensis]|uniref:Uncharacterized protein n=1 Tax=Taibaiella chishuiensis TaxID=1434707 RepID=A0A2P8CR60_9BACT|nr:hypothetical protein [Taibaiella chishuiensis]PSK87446.1 hypothetical protein B0I18_11749 [Taibaiella chishuiensis]